MIDLLNKYSSKYYLQLGDYKFSPILMLTTGFSLEYCKSIKENTCSNEPFVFCFPEKKAAALWTAISILTNYYLVDYIDVEIEGVQYKIGDKVEIYGSIAMISRISSEGEIKIKFKGGAEISIGEERKSQISLCEPHRVINKYVKYIKGKKSARNNRNPISKILEPKSEILINQRNLKSKVLIVAGRGQVKKFHESLETVEIYGEKLGKVFPEGKNLIITADLKKYKSSASSVNEISESNFIPMLKKSLEHGKFEEILEPLESLIKTYNTNGKITEEFDDQFNDLISEAIEDIPELKILKEKYPGISESVSDDFRAVIINDIQQLSDYPDTIKAFLNANIPVIAFADRKVIDIDDIYAFQSLFDQRPNAYRLNWNKKKISSLISYSEGLDKIEPIEKEDGTYYIYADSGNEISWTEDLYIDQALWDQALRYEAQSIRIYTYPGSQLDILIPKLLKHIKLFDEFEILQKSFYNNLYPAIFALKNSAVSSQSVSELISRFQIDLLNVVNQISTDISEDFLNTIEISKVYEGCKKDIEYTQDIFSINVPLEFDKSFTIPVNTGFTNIPTSQTQNVVFTGYPFKEYNGKYLINSVCEFFVPKIEIKCWPTEASLTYNYLKRRIEGGYFFDKLPSIVNVEDSLILKTETDIQTEIDSYLLIDQGLEEGNEVEKHLESVDQFKYKGYQSSHENTANWKVKCDVLNFDDGSFMFLKKGSSILCLSEDLKGGSKVLKKSSDQFFSGDIIFRYIKDRGALVEISKRDSVVGKSYAELEYWKDVLQSLYLDNNSNLKTLEDSLRQTKEISNLEGNPAHYNLNRWLFDDEIISPDEDNLELILRAAEVPNIEDRLATLRTAYKIATAHRISLSTRIKKEIAKKIARISDLNDGFHINLDGEYIDVESRTISAVDTNGVIVDYHNTRKILC